MAAEYDGISSTSSAAETKEEAAGEGAATLETCINDNPSLLEQLGSDEDISVSVSGNTICYVYHFSEEVDQSLLDSIMSEMTDSVRELVDTVSDSTGLSVQIVVIYEITGSD